MALWLSESDVGRLIDAAETVPLVEESFRRTAAGEVVILPRERVRFESGYLAVMAATDTGLGVAGDKNYIVTRNGITFVLSLFDLETGELRAMLAANKLGQLRTGAASGVAAKYLARDGATTLGLIGSGWQAESQLAAIKAAVPTIQSSLVWSRKPERVAAFCERTGAEPAESAEDAGACDIVVTITTSRDPVLRGDWLREGALVCAAGANQPTSRELDSRVLTRASFVCCDSIENAKRESGDLIDPIAAGQLDWLEVHELHEVVSGSIVGRQAPSDIVLFKSNGLASWDLAIADEIVRRAVAQGVGQQIEV